MINLLIDDLLPENFPLKVDLTEADLDRFVPTYELINLFKKKYTDYDFYFCMGADILSSIDKWYMAEKLKEELNFIIITRPNYKLDEVILKTIKNKVLIDFSNDLSSTIIRQRLSEVIDSHSKSYKRVSGLISKSVIQYIQDNNLYKKEVEKPSPKF